MKTKVIYDDNKDGSPEIEVDFVSFVDIPDISEFLGIDSGETLYMGIS
jgi:hypothetical protein